TDAGNDRAGLGNHVEFPMRPLEKASVIFAIGVYIGVDQTAEDDVAAVIDVDVAIDELATAGHWMPGRATTVVFPPEHKKAPIFWLTPGGGVRPPSKAMSPRLFITSWKAARKLPPAGPGAGSPAWTMLRVAPVALSLTYKLPNALMNTACSGKPGTRLSSPAM